jgi:hypothetical protein
MSIIGLQDYFRFWDIWYVFLDTFFFCLWYIFIFIALKSIAVKYGC